MGEISKKWSLDMGALAKKSISERPLFNTPHSLSLHSMSKKIENLFLFLCETHNIDGFRNQLLCFFRCYFFIFLKSSSSSLQDTCFFYTLSLHITSTTPNYHDDWRSVIEIERRRETEKHNKTEEKKEKLKKNTK